MQGLHRAGVGHSAYDRLMQAMVPTPGWCRPWCLCQAYTGPGAYDRLALALVPTPIDYLIGEVRAAVVQVPERGLVAIPVPNTNENKGK